MRNGALQMCVGALPQRRRGFCGGYTTKADNLYRSCGKQLFPSVPQIAAVSAAFRRAQWPAEPFGRRCSSSLSGARRASMTPAFLCALPRSGALQFMAEQKQKALLCNSAYACQAASITDQPPNFSVTSVPSVFNQTGKRSAANPPITHPFA